MNFFRRKVDKEKENSRTPRLASRNIGRDILTPPAATYSLQDKTYAAKTQARLEALRKKRLENRFEQDEAKKLHATKWETALLKDKHRATKNGSSHNKRIHRKAQPFPMDHREGEEQEEEEEEEEEEKVEISGPDESDELFFAVVDEANGTIEVPYSK